MEIREELRYSREHEWARVDGSSVTLGITDFAQDALGDVVFVQLPAVGSTVAAGDSIGEVESTKSVSELFSPVAGVVTSVNGDVVESPHLLNEDPYGAGWLCVVELASDADLDALMAADEYQAFTT